MKKEAIIVAGANGSGKTTFAKKLVEQNGFVFLNADEIAKMMVDEDQPNLKAGRIFLKSIDEKMAAGENFILESTLSGRYLDGIFRMLKKKNYRVRLIYLFLESPEVCIKRIKIRVKKGGHHIPDEDVRRRFFRSKNNFWLFYRQKVDEWNLFFNSNFHFEEVAVGSETTFFIENESLFELFLSDIEQ